MAVARLISHLGSQDGIRWGDLILKDGTQRRYQHDRLNGKVRLWTSADWTPKRSNADDDPARLAEALDLVQAVA